MHYNAAADAGPDVIDNSGLKINKQSTSHQSGLGRPPRQNGECSPTEYSDLLYVQEVVALKKKY